MLNDPPWIPPTPSTLTPPSSPPSLARTHSPGPPLLLLPQFPTYASYSLLLFLLGRCWDPQKVRLNLAGQGEEGGSEVWDGILESSLKY